MHGEPFTDRKSTFQAHLAHVVTTDQVKQVLGDLKKNRKITNATHNIMAYRIYHEDTDTYAQDCDDDGESCAGVLLTCCPATLFSWARLFKAGLS